MGSQPAPGHIADPDPADGPPPARTNTRSRVLGVAAAVVAFGLGAGAMVLLDGADTGGFEPSPAARPAGDAAPAPASPRSAAAPVGPGVAATSPRDAVEAFLDAEATGAWERSFALLAPGDRAGYAGPADWVAAHGRMPTITGFDVETVDDETVTTLLRLESRLDPVLGLVPARMRATWPTVREGVRVRVLFGQAELTPLYPDSAGAAQTAARWALDTVACQDSPVAHPGPAFGTLTLPERLCGSSGDVRVGTPRTLGEDAAFAGLVAAFGPEATQWAVGVPLAEPLEMEILLAPVDDRWVVLGAIAIRGGSG